jgi:hypothetical protein
MNAQVVQNQEHLLACALALGHQRLEELDQLFVVEGTIDDHPTPALQPHAQAGNGVPDKLFTEVPAYEPRFGSGVTGAPHGGLPFGGKASSPDSASFSQVSYYFLDPSYGHSRPLVWLDNAATTHKPRQVIDRLSYFYEHENSNIHRAAHALAARATDAYEAARETVRRFINAPDVNEVIFVRGTTEAINLVAGSWGEKHIGAGDEIVVLHLEHHANIVPWQQLAQRKGARLRVIPVDDSGQILLDEYARLLNERTRLVAITQVSNALGTITPVREIAAWRTRLAPGCSSTARSRCRTCAWTCSPWAPTSSCSRATKYSAPRASASYGASAKSSKARHPTRPAAT